MKDITWEYWISGGRYNGKIKKEKEKQKDEPKPLSVDHID